MEAWIIELDEIVKSRNSDWTVKLDGIVKNQDTLLRYILSHFSLLYK